MAAQPNGAASSVEVYGFVGWITSAVSFVIFLVWAFLPEEQLLNLGVSYYPSKHWALTIPLWISLLYVYIYWTYESINMMTVPECSSLYTIHDDKSKWCEALGMQSAMQSTEHSIPPLVHIPAPVVSRVLYGGQSVAAAEATERTWQRHAPQQPLRMRRAGSKPGLAGMSPSSSQATLAAAAAAAPSGEAAAGKPPVPPSSSGSHGNGITASIKPLFGVQPTAGSAQAAAQAAGAGQGPPQPPPPPRPPPRTSSFGAAAAKPLRSWLPRRGSKDAGQMAASSLQKADSSDTAPASPPLGGSGPSEAPLASPGSGGAGLGPAATAAAGSTAEKPAGVWRYSLLRRFSEASSSTSSSSAQAAGAGGRSQGEGGSAHPAAPEQSASSSPALIADPRACASSSSDTPTLQPSPAKAGPLKSLRMRLVGRRSLPPPGG